MTIDARIVLDSVGPDGQRVTTFQLRYPRFIHADFMTHRVFSRNASSSRATPVSRTNRDIRRDPAIPMQWLSNQKGMQGGAALPRWKRFMCRTLWLGGMYVMTAISNTLSRLGLHKQYANRLTEPWVHISVVVTTSHLKNYFALRNHKDAMPEIQELARQMQQEFENSIPQVLDHGEWHLPYVRKEEDVRKLWKAIWSRELDMDEVGTTTQALIKMSVARCARVSYLTHDKRNPNVKEDLTLFDRLVGGDPLHASPTEHQAMPDRKVGNGVWLGQRYRGNLGPGWCQHRKFLKGENKDDDRY